MRNGHCPKCDKSEVYYQTENYVGLIKGLNGINAMPVGSGFVTFDNYVCVNCGYVENYISNPVKLAKIKERWAKKEPTK